MLCPFLCESRVWYRRVSDVRKPIPLRAQPEAVERRLSPSWITCPALPPRAAARPSGNGGNCPYLADAVMQYCSAASTTRCAKLRSINSYQPLLSAFPVPRCGQPDMNPNPPWPPGWTSPPYCTSAY